MVDPARQVELPPRSAFKAIHFRNDYDLARFKIWLGHLQQRRKELRTPNPPTTDKNVNSLTYKIVNSTYPWTVDQYPGRAVMLSWVIGVRVKTAKNYLSRGLSPPAYLRAAQWLRARAAEYVALADEIERTARPAQRAQKKKAPGGA